MWERLEVAPRLLSSTLVDVGASKPGFSVTFAPALMISHFEAAAHFAVIYLFPGVSVGSEEL